MTFAEYVKSYWHILTPICRYRKTYKNYFSIIINILRNKYPFKGILRNGTQIILKNYYEVYLTSFGIMNSYHIDNDIITISKKNSSSVQLHLDKTNGDVHGVFFDEVYRFLPVKGRVVIDIGANIGDSAIYFALQGAEKIITLEPYPRNHESAKKNIELNNLSNKINLLWTGCSDKAGYITINPKQKGAGSSLDETENGIKVPLMTLENILNTYNIDSALLKMDCEGCEYKAILSSSDSTLQKFTHIQIEYHYGYKNLKERLEKCGFKVSVTNPLFLINHQARKLMYFGYLYAERKN